jgi:general secretion pathway protein H
MRPAAGFTLIEILVVMVILGVLATSVALTLPDQALRERLASLEQWQRQAVQVARLAETRSMTLAWEVGARQVRALERQQGEWVEMGAAPGLPRPVLALAEGLAVSAIEIDGLGVAPASRIVFAGGEAPLFVVRIAGAGRTWRLAGLVSGAIRLEEQEQGLPR